MHTFYLFIYLLCSSYQPLMWPRYWEDSHIICKLFCIQNWFIKTIDIVVVPVFTCSNMYVLYVLFIISLLNISCGDCYKKVINWSLNIPQKLYVDCPMALLAVISRNRLQYDWTSVKKIIHVNTPNYNTISVVNSNHVFFHVYKLTIVM